MDEHRIDGLLAQHPAQRFKSPSRTFSAGLHVGGLISFASSFKFLVDNPDKISESYGWHFQFLTIIGLCLATVTYVTAAAADVFSSPRLFMIKNVLSVTSAPLEVLISILYWGLRLVNPNLVRADDLPDLPVYTDVGMHATPAVLMAVDILFFSPPWSISAIPAMALSGLIATFYWFWIEHCHSKNGFYPYPIFEVEPPLRVGIFIASALVMTLSTFTLKAVYKRINGSGVRLKTHSNDSIKKIQ